MNLTYFEILLSRGRISEVGMATKGVISGFGIHG